MQDAFSSGKVEGYVRALGGNTKDFWAVNTDISIHEIAVKIEDKPNEEEIADYRLKLNLAIEVGQITIADATELDTLQNIKERAAMLAYMVRKNQQAKQQEQMMLSQQNAQVQQQSAIVAEEEKRKTLQTDFQLKSQLVNLEKQWDYKIQEMVLNGRGQEANTREQGRVVAKQVENEGKLQVKALDMAQEKNEPPK